MTVLGQPTLTLITDGNGNESDLVATFNLEVKGLSNRHISIYKDSLGVDLLPASDSSIPEVLPTRINTSISGDIADSGGKIYTLGLDGVGKIMIEAHFNPKILLSGNYFTSLSKTRIFTPEDSMAVSLSPGGNNRSNVVRVQGEISPYIESITPEIASVGQEITIKGKRFSTRISNGIILNDFAFFTDKISPDGVTLTFLPSQIGAGPGVYRVQVIGPDNGSSNIAKFTVDKLIKR